jgi:2-keto-3-deoxy-L-rhamnonate aldolase RhmA
VLEAIVGLFQDLLGLDATADRVQGLVVAELRNREAPRILQEVTCIGVVLIGEGDLSQDLGYPREYEHPVVAEAIKGTLKICPDHGSPAAARTPTPKPRAPGRPQDYRFLIPRARSRSWNKAVNSRGARQAGILTGSRGCPLV